MDPEILTGRHLQSRDKPNAKIFQNDSLATTLPIAEFPVQKFPN